MEFFPQFRSFEENLNGVDIKRINTMGEEEFGPIFLHFLQSCRNLNLERIFIFSHDGTINFFREHILNQKFTRKDLLDTADFITLYI